MENQEGENFFGWDVMPLFCAFTSLTNFFPDLARQIKQTNDGQDSFFFF